MSCSPLLVADYLLGGSCRRHRYLGEFPLSNFENPLVIIHVRIDRRKLAVRCVTVAVFFNELFLVIEMQFDDIVQFLQVLIRRIFQGPIELLARPFVPLCGALSIVI